jgi:hypothetical protein
MGKATVAGLIVERKEVGRPGEFENMSIDELREYIVRESQKLNQTRALQASWREQRTVHETVHE